MGKGIDMVKSATTRHKVNRLAGKMIKKIAKKIPKTKGKKKEMMEEMEEGHLNPHHRRMSKMSKETKRY